jgi:hypothetical protein
MRPETQHGVEFIYTDYISGTLKGLLIFKLKLYFAKVDIGHELARNLFDFSHYFQ